MAEFTNFRSRKLAEEYDVELRRRQTAILKIRLVPGMEMLAQELSTGRRIYDPDWCELVDSDTAVSPEVGAAGLPENLWLPYENEYPDIVDPIEDPRRTGGTHGCILDGQSPADPDGYPECSPDGFPWLSSPEQCALVRRRSQHWESDTTDAYPVIFIEEDKVQFYSDMSELKQSLADRSESGHSKLLINTRNIISIEKIVAYESYSQNIIHPDVQDGQGYEVPPLNIEPLELIGPLVIPAITKPEDEMMAKVKVKGGVPPYRYRMIGHPRDLYLTTDGWLRGHILAEEWPETGWREYLIRIIIEDSSIPVQTCVMDFRYRLHAL